MRKSTIISILMLVILIPGTLLLGTRISGRSYYLTSTLIILEAMIPFFLAFETRKPQAREIVMVAVMAALAAASRAAFAFLPSFKPITAIIMVSGMAFGPEAGFLVGAVSAFASNFMFGQGAWTPWQMMAYGVGGFLAGAVFYGRKMPGNAIGAIAVRAVFGFMTIVCIVGPLLDLCTVFTTGTQITWPYVIAVFSIGLPVNISHGTACAVTMVLLSEPLLSKLDRVRRKYGMMDTKKE